MEIPDKIYLSVISEENDTDFIGTAWTTPQKENKSNIEYIHKGKLIGWLTMLEMKANDKESETFFLNLINQLKEG